MKEGRQAHVRRRRLPALLTTTALLLTFRTAGAVVHMTDVSSQQQHRLLARNNIFTRRNAKKRYVFAVVPKALDLQFFDDVRDGCQLEAVRLSLSNTRNITVQCLYVGPGTSDDPQAGQVQADIVRALLWGTAYNYTTTTTDGKSTTTKSNLINYPPIDGLAVSVLDNSILSPILEEARQKSPEIPIVTFDSDADTAARSYYIGTDNEFMGAQLARSMETLVPDGGLYGILTQNSPNHNARVKGLLAELHHASNPVSQNWIQLPNSPFDTEFNFSRTFQQMTDWVMENEPDILVSVLGFPMEDDHEKTIEQSETPWKDFVDSLAAQGGRNISLVCADALPHQINMLQNGYVDGLVGQLPFDMGTKSMDTLFQMIMDPAMAHTLGDNWPDEEEDLSFIGTNVLTYTQIPLNLPPVDVDNNLIGGLQYVGYTLFVIVALTSISFGSWAFYRRNVRVVRVAQPRFLIMISVGVFTMACCLIPLGMDDGAGTSDYYPGCFDGEVELMERCTAICMSIPWLFCCGFTITFSALYSKTRRVNKIFRSQSAFGRVQVKEKDVLVPFFILLFLNVVILTIWTILDPSTYVRVSDYGRDGWNRVISTRGECRSESQLYFLIPLAVVNMGVLVLANWQAYEARDIESEFSETKYIGICMASLLQAMITGVPVIFVVRGIPKAYYMTFVLLVFVICMVILLVMFVPKIRFAILYMKLSPQEQKQLMRDIIQRTAKSSHINGSTTKRQKSGPSTPFGHGVASFTQSPPPSAGSGGSNPSPILGQQDYGNNGIEGISAMPGTSSRPTTNSDSTNGSEDFSGMVFFRKTSIRDIVDLKISEHSRNKSDGRPSFYSSSSGHPSVHTISDGHLSAHSNSDGRPSYTHTNSGDRPSIMVAHNDILCDCSVIEEGDENDADADVSEPDVASTALAPIQELPAGPSDEDSAGEKDE